MNSSYRYKMKTFEKRNVFLLYTVLFAITSLLVFSCFYLNGKTFVWQSDGWTQHYKALVYYEQYLRSIIKNFIQHHQFIIPLWDFSLGEGSDVLQTLHYYVIGDPFAFFSAAVPTKYMHIYYNCMILLRLYLSGLTFSFLCIKKKQDNPYAVMAGAISYVFCYWALYNVARHPYFLNPMLYMPLIVLGVEKIIEKERPYLYILSVFIAALSNFYFFYMIVLITIVYVAARMIALHGLKIKLWVKPVFFIFLYSLLAVLMSAVIFFPICYTFLTSSRLSTGHAFHLFYPLSHYLKLPALFISAGDSYWMCMGFSAPVLLAVYLLFCRRKKYILLKNLFVTGCIIMIFPFLGQVLNGFSYMCNRWSWAFALLSAFVLTFVWPDLMNLEKKEYKSLVVFSIVYAGICILIEYSRILKILPVVLKVFPAILICFITLYAIRPDSTRKGYLKRHKEAILLGLIILNVSYTGFWKYSSMGENYVAEAKSNINITEELFSNENVAIEESMSEDDFDRLWRYSGRNLTTNANILHGFSSTQYYWTLSNPYTSEFRTELEVAENSAFNYYNYDERAALNALSAVRFYVVPAGSAYVPYGFSHMKMVNIKRELVLKALEKLKKDLRVEELTLQQIKQVRKDIDTYYDIYRNDTALPLVYTYDQYIPCSAWNQLDAVQKQEALLQGMILSDYSGILKENAFRSDTTELKYQIICNGNGVTYTGNSFIVTSPGATVTFEMTGKANCENYFSISGLDYTGFSTYTLYHGDKNVDPLKLYEKKDWEQLPFKTKLSMLKDHMMWTEQKRPSVRLTSSFGISKTLTYWTEDYNYYNDRHNYTINLGYSEEPLTSIVAKFNQTGIYSFDDLAVKTLPMDLWESEVEELKLESLSDLKLENNMLSCKVLLDETQLLCFALPYSPGWTAYVDDVEQPLHQANVMYLGLELPEGSHEVQLIYQTPFLRIGTYVSVVSITLFLICILYHELKIKRGSIKAL